MESFDGPELTSAYPWAGNTEWFIINADNELQLNGYYGAGEEMLYLPGVPLLNNEWHGKVRSEYKGTAYNYFRFFLWCEKPDLEKPGLGLCVRLGYSKSNISLCFQRGNIATTVLIDGRALFKEPQEVEFKVTVDNEGNCALFSRCAGETTFYEEGTAQLPFYSDQKGYYMLGVKYSAEHGQDKYIDDLYIRAFSLQEEEPEEEPFTPLVLELLDQENGESLSLYFNQPVVAEGARFFLSELGEAAEMYYTEDREMVMPVWDKPREKGKDYTLTYSGLCDLEGRAYEGEHVFTSSFGATPSDPETPQEPELPLSAEPGSLRFNEIMADPNGLTSLPQTEYVELYNTSGESIALKDWTFVYADRRVTMAEMDLPADTYLVLCRAEREITVGEEAMVMALEKFPAYLANTGNHLQLLDPSDALIDEVAYERAKPGQAWEWSEQGWFLSTDTRGGTPGGLNSAPAVDPEDPEDPDDPKKPDDPDEPALPEVSEVEPFEIVFNELLPNPYSEGSEYIELYNRSGRTHTLRGLSLAVRKADGTLSTRYSLSAIPTSLAPGDYLLLTKDEEGVLPYYSIPYPENIHTLKLPILNNNSSTLVLFRTADEEVIDELSYSSKWHHSSIREEKGVSLERIDPEGETQDEMNWTSAAETAGFGTPGYVNSQYLQSKEKEEEPTGIEKPEYSRQTGFYSIFYLLDQPGYRCRALIYNIAGVCVAEVANNELIGTQGTLLWDGLDFRHNKLPPGPYIFYLELYHNKGQVKTYKEVFLVH